jgi:hypothetical protein
MPNVPPDVAAGVPNAMSYTINGDGTVTDRVTALMWQREVPATMTWADAMAYCPTLTLGGHHDWRLPTEVELVSLLDDSAATGPMIDATVFPGTPENYFWSSLRMAGSPDNSWQVDFAGGGSYEAGQNAPLYVRCVR